MTLTFTQGANAVSINGSIIFGTDWWDERFNQQVLETSTGVDVVYDNGPTICHGTLIINNVGYSDGNSLRSWFRTYAIWSLNTFTIAAIAGLDLGNGVNTALTTCRLEKDATLKEMFDFVAPAMYNINIPYRYKR